MNKNKPKGYKIAVLGPIPRDHIITYEGEVIEKYGGVNNPTIALAHLLGENSTIIPVTHIKKCDEAPIKRILRVYPNISLQYIDSSQDQGDVIQLRFLNLNQRVEKQSEVMNPITPDDIRKLLDCDAFVMVPVTDFEITLDTLKFIKQYSKALILFDAHGPTSTLTASGDRLSQFWLDRDDWLPYIDILKMNLDEAKRSWLKTDGAFSQNDLLPFAQYCINKGVKALYITLDMRGCLAYFKADNMIKECLIPGIKLKKIVDTTGCGDSFAAGIAFGVLATGDYMEAAKYGNALGAQRTQGKTFEVFKSLAETKKMIKHANLA